MHKAPIVSGHVVKEEECGMERNVERNMEWQI